MNAWQTIRRNITSAGQQPVQRVDRETDALTPQIAAFWAELTNTVFSPSMVDFLWVADRCIQLNAQQVAHMPLRFEGAFPNSVEPAWLSNPDPAWYPNGISDAVHASVDDYYRTGDAFLYVTDYYATGFPAGWTKLDSLAVGVTLNEKTGRRQYQVNGRDLDASRVVQITRNPRGRLRGTSALRSYAEQMNQTAASSSAATNAATTIPLAVLKSTRKLTEPQADLLMTQWRAKAAARVPGEPAILPPELALEGSKLGFSPADLQLIESQEFNARVLASAFGVPPFLINIALTGGLTYQNPAMLGEYWWRTELFSTSSSFARALTAQMLPRGNSVWFDPKHLTQPLDAQAGPDESPAVQASPADQANIAQLRPVQEVSI